MRPRAASSDIHSVIGADPEIPLYY
jgi:hypothetical protein